MLVEDRKRKLPRCEPGVHSGPTVWTRIHIPCVPRVFFNRYLLIVRLNTPVTTIPSLCVTLVLWSLTGVVIVTLVAAGGSNRTGSYRTGSDRRAGADPGRSSTRFPWKGRVRIMASTSSRNGSMASTRFWIRYGGHGCAFAWLFFAGRTKRAVPRVFSFLLHFTLDSLSRSHIPYVVQSRSQ